MITTIITNLFIYIDSAIFFIKNYINFINCFNLSFYFLYFLEEIALLYLLEDLFAEDFNFFQLIPFRILFLY